LNEAVQSLLEFLQLSNLHFGISRLQHIWLVGSRRLNKRSNQPPTRNNVFSFNFDRIPIWCSNRFRLQLKLKLKVNGFPNQVNWWRCYAVLCRFVLRQLEDVSIFFSACHRHSLLFSSANSAMRFLTFLHSAKLARQLKF